jgi:hypothetical protein
MLELEPKHLVAVLCIFCLTYTVYLIYDFEKTKLDYADYHCP